MPKRMPVRKFRSVAAGPLLMALLAALVVAPAVTAAVPAPITLASASDGRTLKLGDVASDDDLIAVVFQEKARSYVRWSRNSGQSFASRVALRDGLRARDPRVAVCGDLIFAVGGWEAAAGRKVGVDYRDVVTGENGRFSLGPGTMADIACFGEVVAVTWVHDDHVWLAVHERACTNPCSPTVKLDLGTGNLDSPPRITSDGDGFTATWITTGLAIQHFGYNAGGAGGFSIVAGPVLTLMAGKDVHVPTIAGRGPRIVVAYERSGQTHMRISDDVGASFGPRVIVSSYCRDCSRGGSQPESVDVRGDLILVEIVRVDGRATPAAYSAHGLLTSDDGSHWSTTTGHTGGSQRGVLLSGAIAEAWDRHFYNGNPYPETEQLIGFQVQSP